MSRAAIFDAIRKARGKGFLPEEVPLVDVLLDRLQVPKEPPLATIDENGPKTSTLKDDAAFYKSIRQSLFGGSLTDEQVSGIKTLLKAMGEAQWPASWTANGLGTAYLETNKTMQPVAEAYFLGDRAEAWRKKNLRYYPWYGRGYPQTTWETNYKKADEALGLKGALLKNPDLMLTAEVAAPTMVRGMSEGWFTGKSLGDYLTGSIGTPEQHKEARRIINGKDRWDDLATYAMKFQAALQAGGWA